MVFILYEKIPTGVGQSVGRGAIVLSFDLILCFKTPCRNSLIKKYISPLLCVYFLKLFLYDVTIIGNPPPWTNLSPVLMKNSIYTVLYESVLVPHSSLKCNSKFRVWTRNFQLGCRNFQFAEVEISSLNSKFPIGMSKFPVCRSRNFKFELEISSWDVEISSLPKSKFPVWKSKFPVWKSKFPVWNSKFPVWNSKFPLWTWNFQFDEVEISSCWLVPTGNFEFELEISTSSNWKFRHSNWKFRVRTGNFHFVQLEISSLNWKFRHPKWKFRVAFQARMWHQDAFVVLCLVNHIDIYPTLLLSEYLTLLITPCVAPSHAWQWCVFTFIYISKKSDAVGIYFQVFTLAMVLYLWWRHRYVSHRQWHHV